MVFGGMIAGTMVADAAPAMPQPGLHGDSIVVTARAGRRTRRTRTLRQGSGNARNPERAGYQQQLGNTSGGPRR